MLDFYFCKHCKNIVSFISNKGTSVVCCGEVMTRLEPNSTDAANEKHKPVIETNGNIITVSVGSVAHPMIDDHFVEWVVLETNNGYQLRRLSPGEQPKVNFIICKEDKIKAVYSFCNLHGLWVQLI